LTLDTYADLFPHNLHRVAEALDDARAKSLAGILRASGQIVSLAQ
jgi:hypothetical protein